ncbi:hypothetical protein B0H10DRAFT_1116675 [Mycena sp. CBHHK59/15]|nr:hypothetical protein B0H10DRAFT_1116675 [Mycena sp. CBHHK59/15]
MRTLTLDGARKLSSFCIRSAIPGNMVLPPERTTFPNSSRRTSRSHFWIDANLCFGERGVSNGTQEAKELPTSSRECPMIRCQ